MKSTIQRLWRTWFLAASKVPSPVIFQGNRWRNHVWKVEKPWTEEFQHNRISHAPPRAIQRLKKTTSTAKSSDTSAPHQLICPVSDRSANQIQPHVTAATSAPRPRSYHVSQSNDATCQHFTRHHHVFSRHTSANELMPCVITFHVISTSPEISSKQHVSQSEDATCCIVPHHQHVTIHVQ